ncbi:MAG: DNA translocase FtsK [bacterium]
MKDSRKTPVLDEALGLTLLGIAAFILLSLINYSPDDTLLYTSRPNEPVRNYAGIGGAYLSWGLFTFLGWGSYLISLIMVLWGWNRFRGIKERLFGFKIPGLLLLLIFSPTIFSLPYTLIEGTTETSQLAGGLVGAKTAYLLKSYFHNVSYLIAGLCLALGFILATNLSLFAFILHLKEAASKLIEGVGSKSDKIKTPERKPAAEPWTGPVLEQKSGLESILEPPPKRTTQPEMAAAPSRELPLSAPQIILPKEVEEFEEEEKLPPFGEGIISAPYRIPPLSFLKGSSRPSGQEIKEDLLANSRLLEEKLSDFGIKARVIQVSKGPVLTRYELQPATGVKVSTIVNLADDIALALAARSVRIEAPIPGKQAVGIEIPNQEATPVYLKEVLVSEEFKRSKSKLTIALGKDISGTPVVADLAKMPHLLIAGTTGSGKSVCINTIVTSLLYNASPEEVEMLMIDPKVVELSGYNDIPHLMTRVVTEPKRAAIALNWLVKEMERRYEILAQEGVRDIAGYNEKIASEEKAEGPNKLPFIVAIVDEFADLMVVARADCEEAIFRLAQMARAVGIHLVLATQRPSVNVITGVIKANLPSRIAFQVSSKVDSRTILDAGGAEKLLGQGDMLFFPAGAPKPVRVQGSFISAVEVNRIVDYVKQQAPREKPEQEIEEHEIFKADLSSTKDFSDEEEDELFDRALRMVVETRQASVSMLQRRLKIGYNRAARLVDLLEEKGVVGPPDGSKPREVLINSKDIPA